MKYVHLKNLIHHLKKIIPSSANEKHPNSAPSIQLAGHLKQIKLITRKSQGEQFL